jgi:hypothetical protein
MKTDIGSSTEMYRHFQILVQIGRKTESLHVQLPKHLSETKMFGTEVIEMTEGHIYPG